MQDKTNIRWLIDWYRSGRARSGVREHGPPVSTSRTAVWHWLLNGITITIIYDKQTNEIWCNGYVLESVSVHVRPRRCYSFTSSQFCCHECGHTSTRPSPTPDVVSYWNTTIYRLNLCYLYGWHTWICTVPPWYICLTEIRVPKLQSRTCDGHTGRPYIWRYACRWSRTFMKENLDRPIRVAKCSVLNSSDSLSLQETLRTDRQDFNIPRLYTTRSLPHQPSSIKLLAWPYRISKYTYKGTLKRWVDWDWPIPLDIKIEKK